MGFEPCWINLIMRYISTVSYAVVLNGQIGNNFYPSRGLRQGDPLSLFLFLICGEGLSSLMRLAQREENFRGVKASRRGPQISHLLFVDDCILFGEVTERGAGLLKRMLREYRTCSGQQVNFDKFTVFLSSNTKEDEKDLITRTLGVRSSNDPERYLGLPNMVGRRKKEAFQTLKDHFRQRINNWSIRHLSQGGKEVFIKAILQAIPTYTMKGHGQRGIHWCTWIELCFLKELGGLGFRSLDQFNIALLAKQGWRISRFIISAQLGSSHSLTWRSIWAAKKLLKVACVGVLEKVTVSLSGMTVGSQTLKSMKRGLIETTFPEQIAQKILQIPLLEVEHDDFQVWRGEHSGEFTVRSAYKLLQEATTDPNELLLQAESKKFYRKLWNLQLPSKIGITIWRFTWNFIPTLSNLKLRKVTHDSVCPRCRNTEEDSNHVLRQCCINRVMAKP
ncbi:reverse transcriptase [Gossypium australe]|uniref:Reverse transcriptase n=1 Tax=Gossypium australe TaxID=47621 RepID=A0A5B6V0X9_9ROSI|nr:reverse transcriptase [Gossypium australe]